MKYLLLSPVDMSQFQDNEEFIESLAEFGLIYHRSAGHNYITCNNLDALTQAAFTLDLPGDILVVSGLYESKEEVTEITKE